MLLACIWIAGVDATTWEHSSPTPQDKKPVAAATASPPALPQPITKDCCSPQPLTISDNPGQAERASTKGAGNANNKRNPRVTSCFITCQHGC
jgi:hypothetical protein